MNLPEWIIPIEDIRLTDMVGKWCQLPYPGHKKGCPNYGKSDRCPPNAPFFDEVFDVEKPIYLVHSEFNLSEHADKMRLKHPNWSKRQCRCLLYWQGTSRKQMKLRVKEAISLLKTNVETACPEGMGVNVFLTAKLSGLRLDKTRNLNICRHITLIGSRKEN